MAYLYRFAMALMSAPGVSLVGNSEGSPLGIRPDRLNKSGSSGFRAPGRRPPVAGYVSKLLRSEAKSSPRGGTREFYCLNQRALEKPKRAAGAVIGRGRLVRCDGRKVFRPRSQVTLTALAGRAGPFIKKKTPKKATLFLCKLGLHN